MLAKIIGLFLASIMIAAAAAAVYPFTIHYAAAAARTDPTAGILIVLFGLLGFAGWARSVLTSFIFDESREDEKFS